MCDSIVTVCVGWCHGQQILSLLLLLLPLFLPLMPLLLLLLPLLLLLLPLLLPCQVQGQFFIEETLMVASTQDVARQVQLLLYILYR